MKKVNLFKQANLIYVKVHDVYVSWNKSALAFLIQLMIC